MLPHFKKRSIIQTFSVSIKCGHYLNLEKIVYRVPQRARHGAVTASKGVTARGHRVGTSAHHHATHRVQL
ncbi:hypothetical protein DPMN_103604 [Dreissena polymorpha]|uniref:Uncharacterized protein n=1 Tax=Dreissena polymorpha TaxID=45954 RepID=A0A9D4K2F2_DREPO|nr:hypothetical protein DPMN_103604 [Dreissena polymorpha]